jgi:hypothetical protein
MGRGQRAEGGRYKALRIADCKVWIADCGLRIADCGLRTADCGLRTADCGLVKMVFSKHKKCRPELPYLKKIKSRVIFLGIRQKGSLDCLVLIF